MKIPTKGSLLKQQRAFKVILLIILLLFGSLIIVFFPKPSPPIIIPQEKVAKTSNWKVYENREYYFSFKYPDVLLSNFQISTSTPPSEALEKMSQLKSSLEENKTAGAANSYNVIFEANGWKYTDTLDKFLSNGPFKDIKDYDKQTIILDNLSGLRISNVKKDKKSKVYFYYNLFKKGNYIYNFSLITDDPLLIVGNTRLLDDIMSTAKFND